MTGVCRDSVAWTSKVDGSTPMHLSTPPRIGVRPAADGDAMAVTAPAASPRNARRPHRPAATGAEETSARWRERLTVVQQAQGPSRRRALEHREARVVLAQGEEALRAELERAAED